MIIQDTWPTVPLGEVIEDMQPGFAQRPNTDEVGVPQLRTNNVSTDGRIDLSEIKYVKASKAALEKYGVRKGDVIFNNTNSPELVGKTAYVDFDEVFVLSNHMTRVRTNPDIIESEFLAHYLHYLWQIGVSSRWAKHWVNQAAIDQASLVQFPVPLPPLLEQARIVDILRQADELRRLRQQALSIKEQILPSLYHEMFSGPQNGRLEEITVGDILEPEDGIRTGPFGTQLKVHELVEIGSPVYGIENVHPNQFVPEVSKFITDEKFEQLGRYAVKPEDVLLTRMGTVGRACVLPGNIPDKAIISYHLFRLRPIKKRCLPDFLAATLNYSPYVAYQLQNFAYGAVMSGLNADTVRSIKMALPPIEIQESFVRIVENMLSETGHFSASEMRVNALFQALLSQAFSGELTAVYRDQHQAELQEAAVQRDIALGLRDKEPRLIDFEEGRVTSAEEEQFRQQIDELMKPVAQEMAEKILISPDALAKSLTPMINQNMQYQSALIKMAEAIRPALPNYENLVNSALAESVASLSRATQSILASASDLAAAMQPIVEAAQRSQALYQSLAQNIIALAAQADAQVRQAAQQEPPQPDRAIHGELDTATKTILQVVQALPTYFTPAELHQLLQMYGRHFDHSQGNDLVQIEAALHLLQTLGFVRRVALDNRLVYRLIDPVHDGALLPTELAG